MSGNLYRFDDEDISKAPASMGVYSLHKAGETIYIGKAEGGGGIRGKLQYHLHGKNPCTKQATGYRYEYHRNPVAKEKELLLEYQLAHGKLPLCNDRAG
ncbi:MAG: hypothetical protein JSV32_03565 [Dehalococcoidia bacterium]|nr:MAG: hypothetical protein JSV32_03565 [Dehalococcoidia bacterium]